MRASRWRMQDAAVPAAVWRQERFGNEAYILTGYFNMPKIFELTLNNGYDKMIGSAAWIWSLVMPTDFADL